MLSSRRAFLGGSVTAALAGVNASAEPAPAAGASPGEVVFQRRIQVRHEVDVFVAGGGPAGVAAAVAAARQGARVFLAERNTCLGGMGTAGMLPLFMPFSDGVRNLAGGIGAEILRRLKAGGGTGPEQRRDDPGRSAQTGLRRPAPGGEGRVPLPRESDRRRVRRGQGLRRPSWRARAGCSPSRPACSSTAPATATWPPGPGPRSRKGTSTAT